MQNKIVELHKIERGCKKRVKALEIPISTIWVIINKFQSTNGAFPLRGMTRLGTVQNGTERLSSARFAFPLQFSIALEWAGLFTSL